MPFFDVTKLPKCRVAYGTELNELNRIFVSKENCENRHGLLNISIWTRNERKKQRVGGQVEACAEVRLRI